MTILIAHTKNLFNLVDKSTTGNDLRLSKKHQEIKILFEEVKVA